VFGQNLFERARMRRWILDLAAPGRKPWECVGTPEETQLALALSLKKSPDLVFNEWPYREDLERACSSLDIKSASTEILNGFHSPHRIPQEFASKLEEVMRRWQLPHI
jgi:hypothetical protein